MIEGSSIEFKETYSNTVLKTAVAFSNTCHGLIYIGVDDDGKVVGVSDPDTSLRQCVQSIIDNIRPIISMNLRADIIEMEGKPVIQIEINEGTNKPYYLREKGPREGGVYVRKGSASIQADEGSIQKMMREFPYSSFESMLSVNQKLSFDATETLFENSGVAFEEQQMRSLGLTGQEGYTNLAYLLSDQNAQGIKAAYFRDSSKSVIGDRTEISGSALRQFEKALEYISFYNTKTTTVSGSTVHKDVSRFPEVAVREAILNAIVHRDYSIPGSTLISVFPDRIEITSLGGLTPLLSMDDLMLGVSSPRNPKLAAVMYRLRTIENYGTGIPKIMESYRGSQVRPEILVSTNAFKVILPAIPQQDGEEFETVILDILSNQDSLRRTDVEGALKVSRARANQMLLSMMDAGVIRKVGSGPSTRYVRTRAKYP